MAQAVKDLVTEKFDILNRLNGFTSGTTKKTSKINRWMLISGIVGLTTVATGAFFFVRRRRSHR